MKNERNATEKFWRTQNIILIGGFMLCLILVTIKIFFFPEDRTYFTIIQTDGSQVIVSTDDVDNAIRNNDRVLNLSDLIVENYNNQ